MAFTHCHHQYILSLLANVWDAQLLSKGHLVSMALEKREVGDIERHCWNSCCQWHAPVTSEQAYNPLWVVTLLLEHPWATSFKVPSCLFAGIPRTCHMGPSVSSDEPCEEAF